MQSDRFDASVGYFMNRIVEIEERDFYFEISPADDYDSEANIPKQKKKGKNFTRSWARTRFHVPTPVKQRITEQLSSSARWPRSNGKTERQKETGIAFDHPPTLQSREQ